MNLLDQQDLKTRFKVVCLRCGSEDVVVIV